MILRNCLTCKKEFSTYPSIIKKGNGRFCSKKCASTGKYGNTYNGGTEIIKKVCLQCKKEFEVLLRITRERPAKYCSRKCTHKAKKIGKSNKYMKGYYYIYQPAHPLSNVDGYIAEHRLVMEKIIGRHLLKNEVVHHMNHNPSDNRPNNLMILTFKEHSSLHMRERRQYPYPEETKRKQSISMKKVRKDKFWSTRKAVE